jgi:ribonuclease P protein component
MLSRKNRFLRKEEFAEVKKQGQSYFSGSIELKIAESQLTETRIGIVVGLKFSKKAVERNKVKRWAREIFREQLPELKKNRNILVIVKKEEKRKASKKQIEEDIKKTLGKASLDKA